MTMNETQKRLAAAYDEREVLIAQATAEHISRTEVEARRYANELKQIQYVYEMRTKGLQ